MLITKIQNSIARLLLFIIVSTMLAPSMLVRADELATTTDFIVPLTSAEEGSSTNKTINPDIQSNPTSDQSTYYIDRYYEKSPSGGKNYYFLGDIPLGADDLQTNTLEYTLPDHLGSTSVEVNDLGSLLDLHAYFPFGAQSYQSLAQNINTTRLFAGKTIDPENLLYYFGARYYDKNTGKFITMDPFGQKLQDLENDKLNVFLSDPQRLNAYSYASNNPINNTDPTGQLSARALLDPSSTVAQLGFWHAIANSYFKSRKEDVSAVFLQHSLSWNPKDLNISQSNQAEYGNVVDKIKQSNDYNSFMHDRIGEAEAQGLNSFHFEGGLGTANEKGFITFSDNDLAYSIHQANVYINGTKQDNGQWNLDVRFSDVYDFAFSTNYVNQNYPNSLKAEIGADLAYLSQNRGVISKYGVNIQLNDKIKY